MMAIGQSSGLSGLAAVFLASSLAWGGGLSANEIIKRSIAASQRNWTDAPKWSFKERDAQPKKNGEIASKTYQVFVIEGSQYNKLIALNDHPLSPEQSAKEEQKLKEEIRKRKSEAAADRNKRVQDYRRERNQDHAMMLEMMNAFVFTPAGEESVRGRPTYVLDATPKPGYTPKNRDTKVLKGMKGRLYVDKATFQWVKVQAEVTSPVSFYGFLAKVEPGTRFVLEQAPVSSRLWYPIHFRQEVNATALGVIHRDKEEDERYSDYRPMAEVLAAGAK
jgi:hypothetical protein